MSHGKVETRPVLAKPLGFATRDQVIEVCKTIVLVQREYGNRGNRKQARMKYVIENGGIKWFRNAVQQRLGYRLEDARDVRFDTVGDQLGWHEQGDGKLFRTVHVAQGRIEDSDNVRYRSAFRDISEKHGLPMIVHWKLQPDPARHRARRPGRHRQRIAGSRHPQRGSLHRYPQDRPCLRRPADLWPVAFRKRTRVRQGAQPNRRKSCSASASSTNRCWCE